MLKAGTITQMLDLKEKLPHEVYLYALRLATILDGTYGENRDVEHSDGGFLVFLGEPEDIEIFNQQHMKLDGGRHEVIERISCATGDYLNILFLCNNEFGINIFLPESIAPMGLTGKN